MAAEGTDTGGDSTAPPTETRAVADGAFGDGRGDAVSSISAASSSKPFLGGYRSLCSGTVFHHAATQTETRSDEEQRRRHHRQAAPQVSSTAQTGRVRSRGVQCPRDASTQCPRLGWVDGAQGRAVEVTGAWREAFICMPSAVEGSGQGGLSTYARCHAALTPLWCCLLSLLQHATRL